VGGPACPHPAHLVEAGQAALRDGFTRYSPNPGYLDLREAIAEKRRRVSGVLVDPATEGFVTVGAMEALMLTFMVALDPGGAVIRTDPRSSTFVSQIPRAGGVPVSVPPDPERGYLPTAAAIAAAITPRTRALLVNTPANPTGAVYPRDLLHALADLALRHDLLLVA